MTVPLVVLAVLSTVGGLIGVPYALGSFVSGHPTNYIEQTLGPVISEVPSSSHGEVDGQHTEQFELLSPAPQITDSAPPLHSLDESAAATSEHAHSPEEIRAERLLALLSVVIAAIGIAIGWMIFKKRPLLEMPRLLENKYYVDEIYNKTIINPITVVSREGLWKLFDIGVIDGFLHGIGEVVTEAGGVLRRLQSGFVRGYAAIILLGALAVIGFFAYSAVQGLKLVP
jgi:NADH-quinone oxidoreductase subunit L